MMMQSALPGVKRFLAKLKLDEVVQGYVVAFMAAFVCRYGKMSASQAAQAIRTRARHRGSVVRFLAKSNWSGDWCVLGQLAELVLEAEAAIRGTWVFIADQTLCGQQGQKTENTFSTGNRKRRVALESKLWAD